MIRATLLSVLLLTTLAIAVPRQISDWLVAGPVDMATPAFGDSAAQALLESIVIDPERLEVRKGLTLEWFPDQTLEWNGVEGKPRLSGRTKSMAVYLAASYLNVDESQDVTVRVEAPGAVRLWLDNELAADGAEQSGGTRVAEETRFLHRGRHRLLVAVALPKGARGGSLAGTLTANAQTAVSATSNSLKSLADFTNITLFDNLEEPTLSMDGRWLAVIHSHRDTGLVKEAWIEIYEAATARLVHTLRPLKSPGNLFFFPRSGRLGFTAAGTEGTTVWAFDPVAGETRPLVEGIQGLVKIVLSPDEKFVYYTVDPEAEEDEADYVLWNELEDRMPDWTRARKLYAAATETGIQYELTGLGGFALDEFALSREGDQIVFTRRLARTGRPYYATEFWRYDLAKRSVERVLNQSLPFETRPLSLTWLPGGKQLAYITASFESTDTNTVRSLSDTDLYLLDLEHKSTRNLTGDQRFSLAESEGRSALVWNPTQNRLWFQALVGGTVQLWQTDPLSETPAFDQVSIELPYIGAYDVAASGLCAFTGSDPKTPVALYTYDFVGSSQRVITAPSQRLLPEVELASFERWDFTNQDSLTIDGWIFYPPDFSAKQKWPLVVYYYGGVSPRDERFNYTYHWWASNGYVVYVLNPVGSVGYGQAFADLHANDWGTLASRDILEGVEKLLADKPFLDAKRMACYGGSYGGFITMDLLTKTDRFAAAVSDAGISNITSYFGGGAWGFTYGDVALPGSFPWNRPDVYVEKSPIFHADKITTPLLLIHGTADNNVPPGESDQMFTALKVLGRDVEYIRFPGEDHSIATKYKNYVTYREMMLEWFDKHLKGQSAAWDKRWEGKK